MLGNWGLVDFGGVGRVWPLPECEEGRGDALFVFCPSGLLCIVVGSLNGDGWEIDEENENDGGKVNKNDCGNVNENGCGNANKNDGKDVNANDGEDVSGKNHGNANRSGIGNMFYSGGHFDELSLPSVPNWMTGILSGE